MRSESAGFLNAGIRRLARQKPRPHPLEARGQPFDSLLLRTSPLYRRSRARFLENGGAFEPAVCGSARVLSSAVLLTNRIEYTPHEKELVFSATDRIERRRDPKAVLRLRLQSVCLFHEQNHRMLWKLLPFCAPGAACLRRYLNFAESLVIALDMALGDALGPERSRLFHGLGVLYDPGTRARSRIRSRREYRNYLQAGAYATYLALELYRPETIERVLKRLFPTLGPWTAEITERALSLDPRFILQTNRAWQKKNRRAIEGARVRPRGLEIPADPLDNRLIYLLGEKVFEKLGL